MSTAIATGSTGKLRQAANATIAALEAVPWTILALPARAAGFAVFWRSGSVKLDDWQGTVALFREEYRVPALPPEFAAYLATAVELGAAVLLLFGLLTRLSALALLGLTLIIQVFVYPEAWPTHIQWLAFLLPLLARGPGDLSLDRALSSFLR